MVKVVITGASGLLGRALLQKFKEEQFIVHGFAKSRYRKGVIEFYR